MKNNNELTFVNALNYVIDNNTFNKHKLANILIKLIKENKSKYSKLYLESLLIHIESGDLIQELGKPVVKCVKILYDTDLLWKSLDGKSSACGLIDNFSIIQKHNIHDNNN